MEQFFYELAAKFPAVKFLKSVSSVCIPDYPDRNLPTVFVYCNGELRKQFVGPTEFGGSSLSQDGQYISHLFNVLAKMESWEIKHVIVPTHSMKSAWVSRILLNSLCGVPVLAPVL